MRKKKNKRFAVFILSHARANEQSSYLSLRESGYTGDIKIVIDDSDPQKEDYCRLYGNDVVIFNKEKALEFTDTMTNSKEDRSVVFARNVAERIAEEYGYQYYAEFDDDLFGFCLKYERGGKLKTQKITDMDSVINTLLCFLDDSNADSIGICHTGILFGGASGVFQKGLGRNFNQSVILRTGSNIKFYGLTNQDSNALFFHSRTGKLMFETYFVTHSAPERASNKGGEQDLYESLGKYTRSFTSVMICPDVVKLNQSMEIVVDRKNAFPKILSERWRKHG